MNEDKNNSTIPAHAEQLIQVCTMTSARTSWMVLDAYTWPELARYVTSRVQRGKDGRSVVAVIPATVKDGTAKRASENVELVTALQLDIEDFDVSAHGVDETDKKAVVGWIWKQIAPVLGVTSDTGMPAFAAFTTPSHGRRVVEGKPKWRPGHPRCRVVVPYSTPIDPETHARLMTALIEACPAIDPACRDAARLMYTARIPHPDAEVPAWDVVHMGTHLLDPSRFVLPEPQHEQDRPRARASARSVITAPTDRPTREDVLANAQGVVERLTTLAKGWEADDTDDLIDAAYEEETLRALATLDAAGIPAPGEKLLAALKRAGLNIKTKLSKHISATTPIDLDAIGKLSQEEAITRTDAGFALTPEALAEALTHVQLPARGGYELWRDIGMSLADYAREGHISQSDAEAVFVGWSRTQEGFQGDEDCISKMSTFKGKGITIGTLIHHAREGGWTPPRGSGVVTGMPADALLVGDEAEVAKTLLAGLRTEVSPEVRGTNSHGARAVLKVSETPTVAYSGGAVWRWDREVRHWVEHERHMSQSVLTTEWSGAPVISGDGTRPLKISRAFASGCHDLLSSVARTSHEVPQDAWMRPEGCVGAVAVEGGVLLLSEDGEIAQVEDHPVWMQRSRIAAPYDPDLARGASHWRAFLDEVFGTDNEGMARQQAVQEYVGATVFGMAHSLQKILLLRGEGLNGKGTLMRAISRLIPDHARVAVTPQQMKDTSREGMHLLLTARLNLVGDVDKGDLVETGLLKRVTGEDEVSFGVKYEPEPRRGTVRCGHIWSINAYPAVRDQSAGFWRRWHILRFDRSFAGKEDPGLESRLARDLPAILAWAVEGAQRLIKQGMRLTTPVCHHEEMATWRVETDSVRDFAVTHADEEARTRVAPAYSAYRAWCDRTGRHAKGQRAFEQTMKECADEGLVVRTTGGNRVAYGVVTFLAEPVRDMPTHPPEFTHMKTVERRSLVDDLKDTKPAPKTKPKPRRDAVAVLLADEMAALKSTPKHKAPAPDHGANDDAEDDGEVDGEVLFLRHIGMDG